MGALLTRLHKLAGMLQATEHRSTVLYPPNWTRTPAGEPPENIEGEGTIVYGDNVIAMFPEVRTTCMHPAKYPEECIYSIKDNFRRCVWCRQPSGLEQ